VTEAVVGIAAPTGEGLAARVGIATGLVVVGNLVGTVPVHSFETPVSAYAAMSVVPT
jgi:class 3 adenylate cyclase